MSIPNLISLARLLSVPIVVWLVLKGWMILALAVFLVAGISDAVDGYLARKLKSRTALGTYLDPIADKVLLIGVFVALGYKDLAPMWLVILVVFRDLLLMGGWVVTQLLTRESLPLVPHRVSKVNTALQIGVACLLLAWGGSETWPALAIDIAIVAVATTTLASGMIYIVDWVRNAARVEGTKL